MNFSKSDEHENTSKLHGDFVRNKSNWCHFCNKRVIEDTIGNHNCPEKVLCQLEKSPKSGKSKSIFNQEQLIILNKFLEKVEKPTPTQLQELIKKLGSGATLPNVQVWST